MSTAPISLPSTLNWTPATATLSDASAVIVIVPETFAPSAGAVRETVGAVVSAAVENETEASVPAILLWLEFAKYPVIVCGPGGTLANWKKPSRLIREAFFH